MKKVVLTATITLLLTTFVFAQKNKKQISSIAFYNLENLFDTEDDPHVNDNEFLPEGSKKWTQDRYTQKLKSIATVIQHLGDDDGPEVLGLCEVENLGVLKDLVKQEQIAAYKYKIVHFDSPDPRGIDVALLYKDSFLNIDSSKVYPVKMGDREGTGSRDILAVYGKSKSGIATVLIVNHWPSRVGGEVKTQSKRMIASKRLNEILDPYQNKNSEAVILIMGDFNDDPTDSSLVNITAVESSIKWSNPSVLLLDKDSVGTLEYRGKWNMFDQIIYSVPNSNIYKKVWIGDFGIFSPEWIRDSKSKTPGKPWRTYAGQKYTGGYSDHFPVFMHVRF